MADPLPGIAAYAELADLVAEYRPQLRDLAHRLLRDCATLDALDGSDLVQEVLLQLLRCPDHVRHGTPDVKWAWLYRLMVCQVYHALRDQQRLKRDRRRDRPLGAIEADTLVAEDPSPDDLVLSEEMAARIAAALPKLTETQRWLIERRFWDGETLTEIARQFGNDVSSVSRMLRRALQKLEDLLPDLGPP